MKRDELLLWLNDRLGKSVHVAVVVERGNLDVTVLETDGKLRFWRQDIHALGNGDDPVAPDNRVRSGVHARKPTSREVRLVLD